MNFVNAMERGSGMVSTENGANAISSTGSALVDLFGTIGALRTRTAADVNATFARAFQEDKLLATKLLFYARNVRGGLEERSVPRTIFYWLATYHADIMKKNLHLIPQFGRWDDLYSLVGTPVEKDMWLLILLQINRDLANMREGKPVSLCAKWLKSVNASSKATVRLGRKTAKALGMSEENYRHMLTDLRKAIDVVEVKISNNDWDEVEYPKVPSIAMKNLRKAFTRHDEDRFNDFISSVEKGEEKINASTLFPYDIMVAAKLDFNYGSKFYINDDRVLEAQWKALPNYITGENNILIMSDTSGSMSTNSEGIPLATAIGLGIYFAERNHGVFKDIMMTFSERPSFIRLKGNTLKEKVECIPSIVANTNLKAAFDLILKTAVENKLSAEEMPKALVVISDMEFDETGAEANGWSFYDQISKEFANAGYQIPNVVFWNVHSRQNVFQVTSDYKGVQMASGHSVAVFQSILQNLGKTPYEAMVQTLSNPIYDCITI